MLLSIIIPSFNNLNELKKCVLSIRNQTFDDFEVWIIDNNSTDGTLEYLQSLEKPFYWKSEKDNGIYDAMNKGILCAKGEWIYFIGADDQLFDNSTLSTINFKKHENYKIIYGAIKYEYSKNDSFLVKNNDGVLSSSFTNLLWLKNSMHHQSIFYKKSIFENLNFNTNYQILADYDLNLQLFKKKVLAIKINKIIALCSTKGISKNYDWKLYKEEIKIKTTQTSIFFKPLFVVLGIIKFLIKKI